MCCTWERRSGGTRSASEVATHSDARRDDGLSRRRHGRKGKVRRVATAVKEVRRRNHFDAAAVTDVIVDSGGQRADSSTWLCSS